MRTSRSDSFLGGKPNICITIGDPAGIGPEVIKKALKEPSLKNVANFLVIGEGVTGKIDRRTCARASVKFIDTAFGLIKSGRADAIVTGPVNKDGINKAGVKFQGHTEYLAKLSGSKKIVMMFVSDTLKVSLVTRHTALRNVSGLLSVGLVYDTVELTYRSLKDRFGIKNPSVGVAGLNPHCGEGGLFGKEEGLIIAPAIKKLQKKFKGIVGPVPADALLHDAYHGKFDAAVCMYHDQGLPAFKMIARDRGVNLTLGLPFIRTSVDHGTGFDIAGKGIADPGSMIEAIKLAIKLTGRAYDHSN